VVKASQQIRDYPSKQVKIFYCRIAGKNKLLFLHSLKRQGILPELKGSVHLFIAQMVKLVDTPA